MHWQHQPAGRGAVELHSHSRMSSTDPQQNYHFSSAAESDQDIFALRLTHNFGAPIGQRGMRAAAAEADVRATTSTSD